MRTVRVDDAAVGVWSAHCEAAAGELTGGIAPATGAPVGQDTAAAARTVDAGVAGAVGALAARMHATGAKTDRAATEYVGTDENSARRIAAIAVPRLV
ncbi:MAG: hypothetical protein K0U84_10070 [Actinomycetia bacterium]|nr:hypothetical protein [Actinomycetes bacterium]